MTEPTWDGTPVISRRIPVALTFLSFVMVVAAAGAWFAVLRPGSQPISITACTADTYEVGAAQGECDRWFAGPDDTASIHDEFLIVGQVCSTLEDKEPYQFEVAWESIDSPGLTFTVLSIPSDIEAGCAEPYAFPFVVPEQLRALSPGPGSSLGLWKIIGRAIPQNPGLLPYQWDASASVELVDEGDG